MGTSCLQPVQAMRPIDRLFDEYGASHRNHTNKLIHYLCVPLIFWSVVALVASIPANLLTARFGDTIYTNWAALALVPVVLYYLWLSRPLALGMLVFAVICLAAASQIAAVAELWKVALTVFIICWILQFWGHKIEGKKPSFLKDLQFLLIGPAWILSSLYKKAGIRW